jgi:hypothetical protein
MRHLVTFILRLWVDPEARPAECDGQVECVATGEQRHVRSSEDFVRFIETRLNPSSNTEDVYVDVNGQSHS